MTLSHGDLPTPPDAIRAGPPRGSPSVLCPRCQKRIPALCLFCPHCDEPMPSRRGRFSRMAEGPSLEAKPFLAFARMALAILGGLGLFAASFVLFMAVLCGWDVLAVVSILAVFGTVPGLGLLLGLWQRWGGRPGPVRSPLAEQVLVVVGVQMILLLLVWLLWLLV